MPLSNNSSSTFDSLLEDTCLFIAEFQGRQMYRTKVIYISTGLTISLNVIACPITVLLNAVIIYTIFTTPQLRAVNSNVVLAMLSVTDLAAGAVAQPCFIASAGCSITNYCNICTVDTMTSISLSLLCSASCLHLALIAIDRFIAIKFPFRYMYLVTYGRIQTYSIVSWTLALLVGLYPLLIATDKGVLKQVQKGVIVLFVIVTGLLISCYVVIYWESRRHRIAIQAQIPEAVHVARKVEFKAAKTTFLVACAVCVTYTINGVTLLVVSVMFPITGGTSNASVYISVECWCLTILLLNSLINPLIYTWRMKTMAKAMTKVIRRCILRSEPQQDETNVRRCATHVAPPRSGTSRDV